MIDRQQVITDIHHMNDKQKYAHVLSALDVVLLRQKGTEAHLDATVIIRTHIEVHNEASLETAKMSY